LFTFVICSQLVKASQRQQIRYISECGAIIFAYFATALLKGMGTTDNYYDFVSGTFIIFGTAASYVSVKYIQAQSPTLPPLLPRQSPDSPVPVLAPVAEEPSKQEMELPFLSEIGLYAAAGITMGISTSYPLFSLQRNTITFTLIFLYILTTLLLSKVNNLSHYAHILKPSIVVGAATIVELILFSDGNDYLIETFSFIWFIACLAFVHLIDAGGINEMIRHVVFPVAVAMSLLSSVVLAMGSAYQTRMDNDSNLVPLTSTPLT